MTNGKRKKYTAEFKFNRVVESIRSDNISSIARQYGIGTNMLSRWRAEFMEKGKEFFNDRSNKEIGRLKKKMSKLEQMVGKKEVELDLIKNFSDFYQSRNGM